MVGFRIQVISRLLQVYLTVSWRNMLLSTLQKKGLVPNAFVLALMANLLSLEIRQAVL